MPTWVFPRGGFLPYTHTHARSHIEGKISSKSVLNLLSCFANNKTGGETPAVSVHPSSGNCCLMSCRSLLLQKPVKRQNHTLASSPFPHTLQHSAVPEPSCYQALLPKHFPKPALTGFWCCIFLISQVVLEIKFFCLFIFLFFGYLVNVCNWHEDYTRYTLSLWTKCTLKCCRWLRLQKKSAILSAVKCVSYWFCMNVLLCQ